jgi:hypothetical protein
MYSFDPEQLDEIQQVFDRTWSAIAKNYLKDDQNDARLRLVKILMDLFDDKNVDQVHAGDTAMRLMCQIEAGEAQLGSSQGSRP